ncbi:hypothetical protein [Paenarthrobacter nitroguajacolicus]|uniref:hypothetical protein n=1 Tax=Paenarthrobacter nitroguajacolicus TaxID=211146 RepID=UPI00248CFF29|nr:hypothetical protein [Paenarthrobacter nitroguajacolicus]MDI2035780.1 hypothetical protein [Paenarthrobacter nitroguajacolicus]
MIKKLAAAFAATTLLAAGVFAAQLASPSPALAEAPPVAASAFEAPLCPGATEDVPNATMDGANLDNYNQGLVVPLYNVFGDAGGAQLPPLCGVRYATEAEGGPAGGGPLSTWMFCTDRDLHACHDGRPLDEDLEKNADMTDTQRREFAYIVQQGFQYVAGNGTVDELVTAGPDSRTIDRLRVQALAWCVADYSKLNADQQATCVASKLGPDDIDETLGFLAQPYTPQLTIDPASSGPYVPGAEAKLTLSTNVVKTPITLSSSNGTVQLCEGEADATLNGSTLTVNEPATVGDIVTVDLCATATAAGTVTVKASATPITDDTLNWFHNGDATCQVYAVFTPNESHVISDSAEIAYVAPAPTETPTPSPSPSTATPTPTPSPSTATPTPTPSPSTATPTPTPTTTDTPTVTPTPSPSESTATPSPSESTATPSPSASMATPTETAAPTTAPAITPGQDVPSDSSSSNVEEGSDLAYTGTQLVPYVSAAAALLAFGIVLMILARRRAAGRHS